VESSSALRSALEADPEVQLAVVFGSAARRKLTWRTDLDVGVLGVSTSRLSALAVALSRRT